MLRRRTERRTADRGASALEYVGLIVVAALIIGGLWAVGIPGQVASRTEAAMCRVVHAGDCGKEPPDAAGSPQARRTAEDDGGRPRATDPLQVQVVSANSGKQPQPNPSPGMAPPPNPNASNWGPSTGAGPGNPGIGKSGDLPRGGDHPYVPPKKGRGKPVKSPDGKGFIDDKGRRWTWDRKHKDHWDVDDPNHVDKNGKKTGHINVNPDGSEARNPNSSGEPATPSASPSSEGKGDGKADTSWLPWGVGVGGGAAGLWWGAKVLSPACGPLAPVCLVGL